MKNYVSYKDFGAVGDGVTNDFFAIKAAHEYANKEMLPVLGDANATYLIEDTEKDGVASSIEIKTDTNWCGATFIFDDRYIENKKTREPKTYNTNPFAIKGDFAQFPLSDEYIDCINASGGIIKGETKRVGEGFGFPAMLVLRNNTTRHFIRYGGNQNNGDAQTELIVIDENGYIDETTPLLFSFERVTSGTCVRLDERPITVENASFISLASRINLVNDYFYMSRGIRVSRANTHIKNLKHSIEGEILKYQPVDKDSNPVPGYRCDPKTLKVYDKDGNEVTDGSVKGYIGPCFSGFISLGKAHNVLVEDCLFQARVYYLQGTYDLSIGESNAITLKNCDQSNFFSGLDPEHPRAIGMGRWWGVMGSNFCKNIVYDGCRLTRFDAHCGLVNGRIVNSEVGYMTLTGGGDMVIENSKLYTNTTLINMRSDYGCTWDGTITVKDSEILDPYEKGAPQYIISVASANHWFGYPTSFPNVILDNVKLESGKKTVTFVNDHKPSPDYHYEFRSVCDPAIGVEGGICSDGKPNCNVYAPPKEIRVINNGGAYELELYDVPFFKDTELEGVKKIPHEG